MNRIFLIKSPTIPLLINHPKEIKRGCSPNPFFSSHKWPTPTNKNPFRVEGRTKDIPRREKRRCHMTPATSQNIRKLAFIGHRRPPKTLLQVAIQAKILNKFHIPTWLGWKTSKGESLILFMHSFLINTSVFFSSIKKTWLGRNTKHNVTQHKLMKNVHLVNNIIDKPPNQFPSFRRIQLCKEYSLHRKINKSILQKKY